MGAGAGQALGIDVGGTKIACLRVSRSGAILARDTVPTPAEDPEATMEAMILVAKSLLGPEVVAVGVGAAGMVDANLGVLRFAPNLAWRELPIARRIGEALGLPCQVDNDANVAAWGEWRFGAGRGFRHMLLVTVGTGIGGGIVADGRLFRGAHGFAAEIGHIVVEPDGPMCGCGNRGCWEQVASGTAIGRLGRRAVTEHPDSAVATLAQGRPDAVTGRLVTEAAHRGDPVAAGILAEVGRRLGEGIAGLVNALDPQVVVVGGGAVEAGDLLLEPARSTYWPSVEGPDHRPRVPIVAAELGNDAGAVGAAALALEELGA
ncbi:MAG TPA: ROK family glucokinase [Actinomycetota bacterium]|jgi:glucokinase|nr:ROK family glucokinase [Actinomycetota bacterium]